MPSATVRSAGVETDCEMAKERGGRNGEAGDSRIAARNKKAILGAAIGVFIEKGYDGASIAEIAKRAGLPKANVYYYFGSKETIYRTIIGDLIDEWDRALDHLEAEREPAEALSAYIRAKLDFSRRHAAQSRMFANEAVHGGRFLSRKDRAHMLKVTLRKTPVFEAWAQAGKMDPVDPAHLFIMIWATTQYYADYEILAETPLETRRLPQRDFDRAAETIIGVVLKGCGIAPPGA